MDTGVSLEAHRNMKMVKEQEKPPCWAKTQILATLSVAWISLIIGYSAVYINTVEISLIREEFRSKKIELFGNLETFPRQVQVGVPLGGIWLFFLGRKWTLLLINLIFLFAWICTYLTNFFQLLSITRLLICLCVGVGFFATPIYIAEISQPKLRGVLGMVPFVMANVGILLCYLFGIVWQWQNLEFVAIFLSVPYFLLGLLLVPESPIWYLTKHKDKDYHKTLIGLGHPQTDIEEEFLDLKTHIAKKHTNWREEFHTRVKPTLILMTLMFFQQMSGINTIISCTSKIYESSGSNFNTNICPIIVGVASLISTFLALLLVDKLGRRILLYISSITMLISLTILGIYFNLKDTNHGWVLLILLIIYILGFSLGFGPIPWLLIGEILPIKFKAIAAPIVTYFCLFCYFKLIEYEIMDEKGIFWLYAFFVFLAIIFINYFVPETKGKTLLDIQKLFVKNYVKF